MEWGEGGRVNGREENLPKHLQKKKQQGSGAPFWEAYLRKQREGIRSSWEKKRIEAERRQRQLRYEEYVKILRASSLDRRLEEQERIAGYAEGAAEDLARDLSLGAYGVHHLFRRYKGFF